MSRPLSATGGDAGGRVFRRELSFLSAGIIRFVPLAVQWTAELYAFACENGKCFRKAEGMFLLLLFLSLSPLGISKELTCSFYSGCQREGE
jgi:hypothetical protein